MSEEVERQVNTEGQEDWQNTQVKGYRRKAGEAPQEQKITKGALRKQGKKEALRTWQTENKEAEERRRKARRQRGKAAAVILAQVGATQAG